MHCNSLFVTVTDFLLFFLKVINTIKSAINITISTSRRDPMTPPMIALSVTFITAAKWIKEDEVGATM